MEPAPDALPDRLVEHLRLWVGAWPPETHLQVVDGRDLAAFVVRLLETDARGPFHAAGPPPPHGFGDLLEEIRAAVAPDGTTITWVDADFARENGLDGRLLPLWHQGERDFTGAVDARQRGTHTYSNARIRVL